MQLIRIDQRTPEWHAWRDGQDLPDKIQRITATTASIVAGTSRFKSTHQLWREMVGLSPREEPGYAALKGARKENVVLAAYMRQVGFRAAPVCIESSRYPWVAASLDGYNLKRRRAAEFKCNSREVHEMAARGEIPEYYFDQVQWQFFASDGEIDQIDYYSFPWDDKVDQIGYLVEVFPDQARQEYLFKLCDEFRHKNLALKIPPFSSDWELAASQWREAEARKKQAEQDLEDARDRLIKLLPASKKMEGGGVSVYMSAGRKGAPDNEAVMKALPIELGIDPDLFAAKIAELKAKHRKPDAPGSFTVKAFGEVTADTETANSGIEVILEQDEYSF